MFRTANPARILKVPYRGGARICLPRGPSPVRERANDRDHEARAHPVDRDRTADA